MSIPSPLAAVSADDTAPVVKTLRHALVVDDLMSTRQWLHQALVQTFGAVQIDQAATLAQARSLVQIRLPDLALVDLGLPDGRGHLLIRELRLAAPAMLIAVPTILTDDSSVLDALCSGADGYVCKDLPLPQLGAALRKLAAGQPSLSPSLARRLMERFAQHGMTLHTHEQRLLQYRARGASAAEAAQAAGLALPAADAALRALYQRLRTTAPAT